MARRLSINIFTLMAVIAVLIGTVWTIRRFHTPGHLDVVTAQAMDMSAMRPPTGAAPVALASVRRGSLDDTVTYTGTVQAFNEQDIAARVTGTVIALPVYPGDPVRARQIVAQLDTAELSAKADQADAESREAHLAARVALINHHLHHQAALDQAAAQEEASEQAVLDAQAQAEAAQDSVADAQAGVQSAQANADYWKTEIAREKQLADAGAASQQEYQSELSQSQAAVAAFAQARSKVRQVQAMVGASQATVAQAQREVTAARAGMRMAQADLVVAAGQADQEAAAAVAAQAAAREAAIVQGYTRIQSPADGIVTARPIAPGTLVQPGTVILKIAEIGKVRLQANVAVTDLAGIHVGSAVRATLINGSGKTFQTRVTAVFPSANETTRTAVVEAVVPNPDQRLLPGQFVSMTITKSTVSSKTLVPASSVISQGGQWYLWVATGGASAGASQEYECVICHIHYTVAQAKKFHFIDPMDGGRLLPVGPSGSSALGSMTAHRVLVQMGASDGMWTEIVSGEVPTGSQVVRYGQAGLTESTSVVPTAWGSDGPKTLPTAASANYGKTLYRCEKCGMTYSAEDARKNNYIDPMDGGRLDPVKGP